MFIRLLLSLALLCTFSQRWIFALHLHGQYSGQEFFRLLTKFGIQKTDQHRPDETFGYIYGNITVHCPQRNCSLARNMLFLILDYDYFVQVYNKQRGQSCAEMMQPIQKIAFDRQCNEQGKEDFWRRVPCPENQLCPDEDQPRNVIQNQQFTFKIRDINQPRSVQRFPEDRSKVMDVFVLGFGISVSFRVTGSPALANGRRLMMICN